MGCILKGGGGLYSRLVVGAVLLAAGSASRMGHRPKALLQLGGVPLVRRQLIALSGAGVDELKFMIDSAFERRSMLTPDEIDGSTRPAVERVIDGLERGEFELWYQPLYRLADLDGADLRVFETGSGSFLRDNALLVRAKGRSAGGLPRKYSGLAL